MKKQTSKTEKESKTETRYRTDLFLILTGSYFNQGQILLEMVGEVRAYNVPPPLPF